MGKRIPILIGLFLVTIAVWLSATSIIPIQIFTSSLDNMAYDMLLRARVFTHYVPPKSPIAIIDIDDKSLKAEGRWPWPRSKLGLLTDRLHAAGAVVIAFDMMFPEKEENIADTLLDVLQKKQLTVPTLQTTLKQIEPQLDQDAAFAKSLANNDSVLGVTFSFSHPEIQAVLPPPILKLTAPSEKELDFIAGIGAIGNIPTLQQAAKNGGFLNIFPDTDGIVRRVPLLLRYQDNLYPMLAFEAVRIYLSTPVKLVTAPYKNSLKLEGIQIGNQTIPTDEKGQAIIPFIGKSFSFPYFSATDVLNEKIPKGALQGKIVFVGTSAAGLSDLRATAVQGVFPGVEIQATIADGILGNSFPYKPAWAHGVEIISTLILGLILVFLLPSFGPRILSILIFLIPAILMLATSLLWEKTGLILSTLIPILLSIVLTLTNMVYGYLSEMFHREQLKTMFGQYVPAKHIDEMLKSPGDYALYGEDREMTVLFADIRNFTTVSEHLSASQLKEMLNQFFTPMTEIIFKHHGTIDKYVGDLIMAFWGAPLEDKDHTQHALEAALEMQKKIKKLKLIFEKSGWPELNVGIGINSGIMSVGDMGSRFRRNYTVLGDAVNLASRVEGLSKHYGANIIVTENIQRGQSLFVFRQLDRVKVKGKRHSISIYELVCHSSKLTPEIKQEIEQSELALNCYLQRDWEKAKTLFSHLQTNFPHTKFYYLYLERIKEFERTPPPTDWDGVFVHTTK